MYLVEVYVTNASLNINYPFTYYYDENIVPFVRVKIAFSHSFTNALVYKCTYDKRDLTEIEKDLGYKLNKIISVIDQDPIITDDLFNLALWLSKTTISPFVACLNTMLPKALKTTKNFKDPKQVKKIRINKLDIKLTSKQSEILSNLHDGMTYSDALKLSNSIVHKLIDKAVIELYEEEVQFKNQKIATKAFKSLTADQQIVYHKVLETNKRVSLLFGVTGSGKTEVYLHLTKKFLEDNKMVLILVPEISLTPQMIMRVKERFEDVIFYHSELSDQERYEQYKRVKEGKVKVIVGTRSAVFLPFENLGLIIIDEEHDSSYKQDNVPCYHVKNVALKRAIDHDAKLLLASATPSLDSYTRALKGDYEFLKLEKRINLKFPEIEVIDLNEEIKNNHNYILSNTLIEEINNCLSNNKQVIILLNRRGYSNVIRCLDCNGVLMCQDCDTPLNYHKDENVLKCHQCGRTYQVINKCPNCGSNNLLYYGFGTKRVEEELKNIFKDAKIERMDRDNVTKKGAHKEILDRFGEHQIDILVGTQMIAKGLDYPDVTLVGILNADAGLLHQDYNASKITFDLLMQASGRSGRALDSGKVLIQAFNTEHYVIKAVLAQDYNYFYNIEMNYRHKTLYPPYRHLIAIFLTDINKERLIKSSNFIYEALNNLPFKLYKPLELNRLMKMNRMRIVLLDKDLNLLLKEVQKVIDLYIKERNVSHIKVDIDPLYLE